MLPYLKSESENQKSGSNIFLVSGHSAAHVKFWFEMLHGAQNTYIR